MNSETDASLERSEGEEYLVDHGYRLGPRIHFLSLLFCAMRFIE